MVILAPRRAPRFIAAGPPLPALAPRGQFCPALGQFARGQFGFYAGALPAPAVSSSPSVAIKTERFLFISTTTSGSGKRTRRPKYRLLQPIDLHEGPRTVRAIYSLHACKSCGFEYLYYFNINDVRSGEHFAIHARTAGAKGIAVQMVHVRFYAAYAPKGLSDERFRPSGCVMNREV